MYSPMYRAPDLNLYIPYWEWNDAFMKFVLTVTNQTLANLSMPLSTVVFTIIDISIGQMCHSLTMAFFCIISVPHISLTFHMECPFLSQCIYVVRLTPKLGPSSSKSSESTSDILLFLLSKRLLWLPHHVRPANGSPAHFRVASHGEKTCGPIQSC